MELHLTSSSFEQEVYQAEVPVLVDFYADWCGPCKAMAPVVEELAKEYEGKAKVGKINTDENQDIAIEYSVMSIPTFIVFKDGKAVKKMIGMQDKRTLIAAIEEALQEFVVLFCELSSSKIDEIVVTVFSNTF